MNRNMKIAITVFSISLTAIFFNNCSQSQFKTAQSDLASLSSNVPTAIDNPPNTPIPPIQPLVGLPAWRQGMVPFQWKKFSNTSINTVSPKNLVSGQLDADGKGIVGGLYGRLDAWNGLAADTRTNKVYAAGGGGHADYAGNEVYEIDFSKDVPVWNIIREPSLPNTIRSSNYNLGLYYDYYLDGRPSSTHQYYALQFLNSKNAIYKFGAGSLYGTGNEGNSLIDEFSLATSDWTPGGNRPFFGNGPRDGVIGASVCKNPDTDEVYIGTRRGIQKYNPVTNQVTMVANYFAEVGEIAFYPCAVDVVHKQLIFFGNLYKPAAGGLKVDLTTGAYSQITFLGPAIAGVYTAWRQNYAWYDEKLGYFILKGNSGAQLTKIDPVTYETSFITSTGGDAMTNATNGVQTRFQRLPQLKGYIYYPSAADGFWFLATE